MTSTWQAIRASRAEKTALQQRDRANANERAEAQARARETEQRQVAEGARVQADAQKVVAQQAPLRWLKFLTAQIRPAWPGGARFACLWI